MSTVSFFVGGGGGKRYFTKHIRKPIDHCTVYLMYRSSGSENYQPGLVEKNSEISEKQSQVLKNTDPNLSINKKKLKKYTLQADTYREEHGCVFSYTLSIIVKTRIKWAFLYGRRYHSNGSSKFQMVTFCVRLYYHKFQLFSKS